MTSPIWKPTRERRDAANLTDFRAFLARRGHDPGAGYEALWRWSLADQAAFWDAFWDWSGVVGDKGDAILETGPGPMDARYFPGARLNFAENLLQRTDAAPAVIAYSEAGPGPTLSWRELRDLVSRVVQGMQAAGVRRGDRVALLLPNVPEAIAAVLAAASLGAVTASASPDFGVDGVVDRFGQIAPRLLIGVDGYQYGGKWHSTLSRLAEVTARLPSVERVVVVRARRAEGAAHPDRGPLADLTGAVDFPDFIEPFEPREIPFARLPFEHPLYILFSSGTTGPPKCIVHSAGGVLLQHLKEQRLHADVKAGDRVFYFTTLGWMMWNWLVSILGSRATVLLYDGSPSFPGHGVLFDFADWSRMTHFGTSARFITTLRTAAGRPRASHALDSLRTVLSTGSPLDAAGFRYVHEHVKRDVHLASVSGGTDLCACFVGGLPTRPVFAGEIQGPAMGMAVEVYDDGGRSLDRGKGELVCTRPFPSMPVGFWGDEGGERYRDTYFRRFPGVWHHGDFIERTASGGYVIHGRSDATLIVAGVRIGTAEVYRVVEALPEVREAIAIGQRRAEGTRMVLFVRLRAGHALDEGLRDRIRARLRKRASPRHVPAAILQVPDIPRTRSGKIVELAVRAVVHGEAVRNRQALANPEALEHFRDRPELTG
ncbi:MAG: acetoacetate--CoA ligase [Gammaproteobacteria bacterium]|nr:acetoacetate--CoA ligase [Gammaproteobacteria bacterium]MYC51743.1 acetoacetate--CoA ligase [Gammaproteobacteria bacterium]